MRIVDSDFDGLVEKFGVTRRLATRLGALARAGLFVTESVAEIAADKEGKALAAALTSKAFLDAAEKIADTAALKKALGATVKALLKESPLALAKQGDRRVICLAEEEQSSATSARGLALPAQGTGMSLIARDEAAKLLDRDEVSRLKLDLITSSDVGKRLEAVRKIWLSDLAPAEKSRLFLAALRDKDPGVRAEAARGLGGLGLDGALTENLARASSGLVAERIVAIANLGQLFERLEAPQRKLALAVVMGFIVPSEDEQAVKAALGLLATTLARLGPGEADDLLFGLHKQLIELLQVKQATYEDAAQGVYAAMYDVERAATSRLLAESITEVSQKPLQYFALSLICRHDLEAAAQPRVLRRMVLGLQEGSEIDRNFLACAGALTSLGDASVAPLAEALRDTKVSETGRERVADQLGQLLRAGTLSAAATTQVAHACLECYESASGGLRVKLLETGFYEPRFLGVDERASAARMFVDDLHVFRFERQLELLQNALRRCGAAALKALTVAIAESAHDITRLTAARLLPDILEGNAEISARDLGDLVTQLRGMIEGDAQDFPDRGPLYIALGRIAGHARTPADVAQGAATLLGEHLGTSSAVYDVIEALGYLGAGRSLDGNARVEIGHRLIGYLRKGLPRITGVVKKNPAGEAVLHFGRETTAYTDMIPRVLEGLGRMLEAGSTPKALHERIVTEMSDIWRDIADYRVIWAPTAVITLARLLGDIGLSGRYPETTVDEIAELLLRRIALLPVMQVLSRLALLNPKSARMNKVAGHAFNELVKRLSGETEPEMVERRQILETMSALARRDRLGEKDADVEHARRVLAEALFDAMKDKVVTARGMLDDLANLPSLSENLRADIRRRLKPGSAR
ncbi:MAG: hypothetical protein IT462_11120 [Planctomycetes bacterium]|nr:hypothetical protein [Planctomycetota bacterium]